MSYYCKKRMKAGLSKSEVANALGIDYKKYVLIDKGVVKMPNKLIDKFNELINKTKTENDIDRINRKEVVDKWWKEMSVKKKHGVYVLNDKMKEFNIDTLTELSLLIGSNKRYMSDCLNKSDEVNFETKNRLYSFFENELNIQPPKDKKKNKRSSHRNTHEDIELINWWKSFDINKWCTDNNLTRKDILNNVKLSSGTICNLFNNKFTPYTNTLVLLKEYIDSIENKKNVSMEFTAVPVEKVPEEIKLTGKFFRETKLQSPKELGDNLVKEINEDMKLKEKLINKYGAKLEEIENNINKYKHLIEKLECEKVFYEEILKDINED